MGTAELRQQHIEHIAAWIGEYVQAGHRVRMRAWHGRAEEANTVAFLVADWPAFVAIMEPGAQPIVPAPAIEPLPRASSQQCAGSARR